MAWGRNQHSSAERRRRWLRAAGLGLIAASATFGALSVVWQPQVARSVIAAEIAYQPGVPATRLDLERVRAEILSDDALRASAGSDDSAQIAAWRHALSVHRGQPAPAGDEQFVVQLTAEDEAAGVALVRQLTHRFLSAQQPDARGESIELTNARAQLAHALASEDAARRELDSLTKAHVERLRRAPQLDEVVAAGPAAPAENPAYVRLEQQWAELQQKRDSLLLNLTTEHPQVLDVDGELEELQSRRAVTPRYLESPGASRPAAPSRPAVKDTALAAEEAKLQLAHEHYDAARGRRLEAQAAVEVLERSTAEASTKPPHYLLAQSPQVIERVASVSAEVRLLALLGISSTVMLAVVLLARPRHGAKLLASPEDITRLLGVPVVARLKLGNKPV